MSEVFLLGAGSIGGLIATQLSRSSKSPVTLLLNSELRLTNFLNNRSTIRYKNLVQLRNPIIQEFQFKAMAGVPRSYTGAPLPIQNLIVTTKCHQTLEAITKLIPSLDKNSNVILIQNGIGVADLIKENFYIGAASLNAPKMYQGVINHGVFTKPEYEINHVGLGDLKIARIPYAGSIEDEVPSVIEDLVLNDILSTSYIPYNELMLYQYEKLIVNLCINALTAVLDCTNGELLKLYQTQPIFNGIIREAVQVIMATASEDLKQDPTLQRVIDLDRLLAVLMNVARDTKYNSSSMREDVRHLKDLEIDFINGFFFKQGKVHGIFTPYNKMIIDMVKLKLQLNRNRNEQAVKMSV